MKVYELNEITDSRILYDKNPPKFIVYIILIVVAFITAFLIWADRSVKTYVVRSQGMVTAEVKTNIMSNVTGSINNVYIKEGKEVKSGEVLLTINPVEPNLQLDQLNAQISYDNKRIELLKRAEQNAENDTNNFDKNSSDEIEFYNRLQNGYVKKDEYKVDENSLKAQGYNDDQIKQYKDQQAVKLNELHYDTVLSFTNEKNQLESEKSKLDAQKAALEKGLKEYKITAEKDGKVHLAAALQNGMVLQQGNLLGSISNSDGGLVIQASISSQERPMVNVGEEVSLAIAGLNQAEYGTLKGKVISIDQDANVNSEKGNVYFNLKIKPKTTFLKNKKGNKVKLTLGMVAEARVKYEKITYMKYFLEQIGIKLD